MIITKDHFIASKWLNGLGQTLQIIISPPQSDFKLQEFEYRVSIATLTTNLSPFSLFPKYNRWLLILAGGPVKLINKSKGYEQNLEKLNSISFFDGQDEMESKAQVGGRDFNLFVRKDLIGELCIKKFIQEIFIQSKEATSAQSEWKLQSQSLFQIKQSQNLIIKADGQGSFIFCKLKK